jgi:dephospho-CoA kinase
MKKYRRSSVKVIGLTGGFGTGKSYAAGVFKSMGARVIDADKLAHDALKKSSGTYRKIKAAFGQYALDKSGNIDRKKLARAVFSDEKLLKKLNAIIHPGVIRAIKANIRNSQKNEVVVLDAPLLIEARKYCRQNCSCYLLER